jgi:hypothetical protein
MIHHAARFRGGYNAKGLSCVSGDRDHRLFEAGGTLESAQAMAAHEIPRTT